MNATPTTSELAQTLETMARDPNIEEWCQNHYRLAARRLRAGEGLEKAIERCIRDLKMISPSWGTQFTSINPAEEALKEWRESQ